MFSAQLDQLELFESWTQEDPEIVSKSAIALSSREGSASTQVFYMVCEPRKRIGRHVHSAEEVLLVLEGTAEVSVGDERGRLSAAFGGRASAHPSRGAPRACQRRFGYPPLRSVPISAAALHTWEVPLMPMESTTFVTPPAEEGAVRVRGQMPRP